MENKVQLCGKYSTFMQIIVVVIGVKFQTVTAICKTSSLCMENTTLSGCLEINTALSFASCCIFHM